MSMKHEKMLIVHYFNLRWDMLVPVSTSLALVPFLAEMADQSPYRAGVLFLPILDQSEMCHNW